MEPITIIMILLGIALLVGSCFLTKEDKSETSYDELINRLAKRELTTEETGIMATVTFAMVWLKPRAKSRESLTRFRFICHLTIVLVTLCYADTL